MPSSTTVLQGRSDCTAQLRTLLCALAPAAPTAAAATPSRAFDGVFAVLPTQLLLADTHFADWPLDEPAVLASLSAWLRPPGRALRIIGLDFEVVARRFPRFARWRRDWAHRLEVWQPADANWPAGQRLLLAPKLAAQWLDAPTARLRVITNAVHVQALHAQSADFLQRCEPAWPVTTLGL